jgi:hypothetical protein
MISHGVRKLIGGDDLPRRESSFARRQRTLEIAIACFGIALLLCAVLANQRWLDRHFLPSWFLPHGWHVFIESSVRAAIAVTGALALIVRRRMGHTLASAIGPLVLSILGAGLALGASELRLRRVHLRAAEWLVPDEEPRRQPDPRTGWTFVPARTGRSTIGARIVEYSLVRSGYRVRQVDDPVDTSQPTIVFIGESVMFGEGLMWDETIPAQVGAMMRIQSANLAVHGFSSDQAYLRLETELPRFQRPAAVVSLFMTALFGRNLDDDRPHLGPGLVWLPAEEHGRLASLATLIVPYRTNETVERGVTMTRNVLGAIVSLAHAHGATPLIVVPHFGVEDDAERGLRRRILDVDPD